jgi:hypothetical protein
MSTRPTVPLSEGVYFFTHSDHFAGIGGLPQFHSLVLCSKTSRETSAQVARHFPVFVDDTPDADIACFFDPVVDFIEESRRYGDTLICTGGGSRSTALAVAFLIRSKRMGPGQALHMMAQRGSVSPNPGFRRQLYQYAQEVSIGNPVTRPATLSALLLDEDNSHSDEDSSSEAATPTLKSGQTPDNETDPEIMFILE